MKRIALVTVFLACLAGCGQSPAPQAPSKDGRTTMQQFKIGSTDFGIDATTSSFIVDSTDPERPTINIEIAGDPSLFEALSADEDSEWSWALYPPGFYLRKFPAQIDPATGVVTAHVQLDDVDNYEFAILMMEHNNIDNVTVKLVPDKSIEVTGHVDLVGDPHDFAIHWKR
jgi:hypothetical protein